MCETCPNSQHLHPHDIHPATQRLIQLRLMLDAGAQYDRDEIDPAFWQILGEMKRTQKQQDMTNLAITLWGTG